MAESRFVGTDIDSVWIYDSGTPGPTAMVEGGVHGDERAGIETVKQLVSGEFPLTLERGKLIVALGNLAAIEANVRLFKGRPNMNRMFRSLTPQENEMDFKDLPYEIKRAQSLLPYMNKAGSLLDLHGFRQHDGKPFIITETRGFEAARAVGAPYISSGWSIIEAGGTDGYMEEQGNVGLCFELSQLEDLAKGIPNGRQGVLNYLGYLQLIEYQPKPLHAQPTYVHATKAVLAQEGFRWRPGPLFQSFQRLTPGELIAQNGTKADDAIYAGLDQVIIFPSDEAPNPGDEMFNLGTLVDSYGRPLRAA